MKRFLSGILIFVTVFNIYAVTSESVSATLHYNLTNTDYLFGFAANEEGLWATNNSQISYGITGVYKTIGRIGYSSSYSIEVEYTYNVVNGLVTEMQAVIL